MRHYCKTNRRLLIRQMQALCCMDQSKDRHSRHNANQDYLKSVMQCLRLCLAMVATKSRPILILGYISIVKGITAHPFSSHAAPA